MKKAAFMTVLVLLLAISVVAQTTTTTPATGTITPGTTAQGQTTPSANPTSLTGCLSGPTNGVYTLRTLNDNRVYTLRSDNPLASHDNHAVTVTGTLAADASTTTTSTTTTTGTNPSTNAGASAIGSMSTTNPTSASGTATGSGNAQTTASVSVNAPVFTVTNIAMANESCEAGSSAIGTGTPTTSATGQVNTTASGATAGSTNSSTTTTNQTASGQTSTNMAGAQGTEVSGCLMASNRDAGKYFLRTTKGKKFVTEVIPDATLSASIAEHVGHQVRLTGQFTDVSASTAGDTTITAQAGSLPQSDQPEKGKKAHEQDRSTGRQFTASNIEMISVSGCPQSSTKPNSNKSRKPKAKTATDHDKDMQKQ